MELSISHSDSIAKIAAAFVKAQKEIKHAMKLADNPHFKSSYADLSEIDAACRPALNAAGIAVIQSPARADAGKLALTTMLLHESGEFLAGTGEVALGRGDGPQAYGSALTYARRYHLAAMTGVCPVDDDGEGAEGRNQQQSAKPQPPRQQARPAGQPKADEASVIKLTELLQEKPMPPAWQDEMFKRAKVTKWSDMSEQQVQASISAVLKRHAKGKAA